MKTGGWSASKHEAKQIIDACLIPIVGARTLSQVVDNLRCLEVTLDSAQLQRLDDLSRIELNFLHDFLHSASVREVVYGGCYNKIVNHLPEGEAMYLVVLVMRVTSKVGSRVVGRWLQLDGCSALRLLLLLSIALMQPASASAEELNIHPRISQVQGGAEDVFANAYIMEGKLGTVVIDSLLTCSASRDLRRRIDALGKPLLAVIVTHGHPDHYGGVTQLVEGREHVLVVAVKGVDTIIRRDDAMKEERLAAAGFDWPTKRTFPNVVIAGGVHLTFGDTTLTAIDVGEAESHHDSIWILHAADGDHAFIGDLVMNGVHAYTADGHTGRWIESLRQLENDLQQVVQIYPGHGDSGGVDLLKTQRRYLEEFRSQVRDLAGGQPYLSENKAKELQRRMINFLGHDKVARWVLEGANPVAKELASPDKASPVSHIEYRHAESV